MDAIASQGLGPQAGLDSMGLVGQLPRTIIDDTPKVWMIVGGFWQPFFSKKKYEKNT